MAKKNTRPSGRSIDKLQPMTDIVAGDKVKFINTDHLNEEVLEFANSKEEHEVVRIHNIATAPILVLKDSPKLQDIAYPFMVERFEKV